MDQYVRGFLLRIASDLLRVPNVIKLFATICVVSTASCHQIVNAIKTQLIPKNIKEPTTHNAKISR